MFCQKCGKNPVNVQINTPQGPIGLCPSCALQFLQTSEAGQEQAPPQNGINKDDNNPAPHPQGTPAIQLPIMLPPPTQPHIVAIIPIPHPHASMERYPDITCQSCGATFREFAMSGYLSCPSCYEAFSRELKKGAAELYGSFKYKGKFPVRAFKHLKIKKMIEQLQERMEKEVKEEHYETAAKLRDTIRKLENESEENP